MFQMTARLQPGITADRAEAELDAVARQMEHQYGDAARDRGGRRVLLVPGGKVLPIRKQDRPYFTEVLMVLGGLVLLIACSNVANMMLARAAGRRREIAVRLTLGAKPCSAHSPVADRKPACGYRCGCARVHPLCVAHAPGLPDEDAVSHAVAFDLTPDWRVLLFALGVT